MSAPAAVGATSRSLVEQRRWSRRHMNQSPDITKIPNERPQVFILHKGLDRLHKGLEALLDGQKAKPPVAPPLADLRMPAEPARKPRRPTLASVAKQANRAAIAVARYEVKPDGTIVLVTGQGESTEPENPWLAELPKETKQ